MSPSDPMLIVGNGGAAAHAVMGLRAAGFRGEVWLVTEDDGPVFNPMLAPYYLDSTVSFEGCYPFGFEFYRDHEVRCDFGSGAASLDTENRVCHLKDGRKIHYHRCLFATGARPVYPRVQGLSHASRALALRTPGQTIALKKALSGVRDVVILGSALVGIRMAGVLIRRGLRVTLVDLAPQILPRVAHPTTARLLENHMRKCGADILPSRSLEGAEEYGDRIHLDFGAQGTLHADLCLVCTGVRPNLEPLSGSSVRTDQGVDVDERLRSSAPGLYAAGDVSRGRNLVSGEREVIGTWGNACRQGWHAGYNMAGGRAYYLGAIPEFVTSVFRWTFVSLGNPSPEGDGITILAGGDSTRPCFRLLLLKKEYLIGANLINCTAELGKIKGAIVGRHPWTEAGFPAGPFWLSADSVPSACPAGCRCASLPRMI
jgi:NADPH-dependent 2,4-dienoyl-CoA reductase/sulfur reductase-like enzyme